MPLVSAAALNGSATMKPAIAPLASAGPMSAGAMMDNATSLALSSPPGLVTTFKPFSRSRCCSTTLWIEYQKGTPTFLPPRSLTVRMLGATVRAEPLMWFQATTLAGNWLP